MATGRSAMNEKILERTVHDLLCQALETELGGVEIYRLAILCAGNADLRKEWTTYLAQTERHVEILADLFENLGLDADATTPGRTIVRAKGQALVSAMRKALKDAPDRAQIVAAECVVDAESKDHLNWKLIGEIAKSLDGSSARLLEEAYKQVEDEEDEHLYHSRGWCRELWLDALHLDAVLPPPEETGDVTSAAEAAEVERKRKGPKSSESPESRRQGSTGVRRR
jgi:hypothetical protein